MQRYLSASFWALINLVGQNWITRLGAILTTISAFLILAFLILGLMPSWGSPYAGLMGFVILPGLFVFGLALIPVGLYWERRKRIKGVEPRAHEEGLYPKIDFNNPRVRHLALAITFLTVVNFLIISIVTYEGVVFMDTVQFCGKLCHTVMKPEYTSYQESPHARVRCVECHIGPGAPWFVKSKISGVRQVFAVAFDTYTRPIQVPIKDLRPSRETCEQCHWPKKFTEERIRIIPKYADDETNTPTKTVLLMHIGGGGQGRGIHGWHMDPERRFYYIAADRQRQKIPWVEVQGPNGQRHVYTAKGDLNEAQIASSERRLMDCIDCHNRPTHILRDPDQAMNQSLASGRIDSKIPYIKKVGTEALQEVGLKKGRPQEIEKKISEYYASKQADFYRANRPLVDQAIQEITVIYNHNVFPEMDVKWSTYPDNIGHERFPGCFRCHDSEHADKDGAVIEQDCDLCHTVLAQEEKEPEILKKLGIQ